MRTTALSEPMDNSSSLPDAAARARALEAAHSFIVQAPAGSGKTELLTQRYLRLLAYVERPEQILAITFTRKAASEMRNRILKALHDADAKPKPEKAHELLTWQLARAACDRDRERGWRLLSHPARLRIQTIDALNLSLARRLPILSGAGANLNIAPDTKPLYQAACLRVVEHLGRRDGHAQYLETVLFHLGNRVDRFMELLEGLLAKRDQWLPIVLANRGENSLRASLEQVLNEIVCRHLAQLRAAIPAELHRELAELIAHSAHNRLAAELERSDGGLLACRELMALPDAAAELLEVWQTVARLCLKDNGDFYKKLDKRQGFPTSSRDERDRMLQLLDRLRNTPRVRELLGDVLDLPSARYDDAQWQVLQALLNILPFAEEQLCAVFKEQGAVDYVESAWRALQALGTEDEPTDVALAFDERLQHILVDEFQDTSFTQLELLKRLTAGWTPGDGRSLFCVGDPMQSIYRFREAEVGLFLELQTQGLSNVPLEALKLSVNFRSTRPIVQWINEAFPRVLPSMSDAEQGAVSFSRSEPQPRAASEGGVQVHAAIDRGKQAEAQLVVQLVREALSADPQSSVAILVANRRHVGEIAAGLATNDIPFQAVEIEHLRERPVVQDLLSLTRALVHLGDRTAWLSVLRAPWCGLSLADLHALAADDAQASVWSLLSGETFISRLGEASRVRVARLHIVLEAALAERGRYGLRDWVERCWNALGGPATSNSVQGLQDAEAYFARLEQVEVAADLEDVARLDLQLDNLYARPRPDASSRVEIMTIHKAKGLEFDTVILPALERGGGRDDAKLLQWSRVAGLDAGSLVLAPITAKGAETDPVYHWLKRREQRRTNYERGRQLYVAATRARKHLHLLGSVGTVMTKDEATLRKPRAGSLLALLWSALSPEFEKAWVQRAEVRSAPATYARPILLRRLPLQWSVPTPAAAVPATQSVERVAEETERPEFDWVGETARHVGTLVHRELERLVKAPLPHVQNWNGEARRAQFDLEIAELGVPVHLRREACERVIAAVQATLSDPRGRWILNFDQTHRDAMSEIALSGVDNGQVISVIIDRSFVDRDGTRWIVDFKTSSHEGGGREQFLASEEARYRPQLARYAKLMAAYKPGERIKTALYFPLLGAWREVEQTPQVGA